MSTGNAGLDEMLEGGVIARRPYLIVGPAGTGKTTLALQFLCEGVRRGERCLLVTIEEPPNEARLNHRSMSPLFDRVEVFDAIPDVMRYERVPFKDISAVRSAIPFSQVPLVIRRTPELTGVEVTITGLEQMLRSEVVRKGYTRVVVDSLTALQYFCMKGFNEVAGAQTFLRFLSDLRVTTLLTVESPLEDVDTTERMLARGEVRLFRWELDGATVRAIGVEKFRGSSHDVRLHPYRIGPQGLDINLAATISRDTRQIVVPLPLVTLATPPPEAEVTGSPLDPLFSEVEDLRAIGAEVGGIRPEIEAALAAVAANDIAAASGHVARASALSMVASGMVRDARPIAVSLASPGAAEALVRVLARSEAARAGVAPTNLPASPELEQQLRKVLDLLPAAPPPPRVVAAPPAPEREVPPPPPEIVPAAVPVEEQIPEIELAVVAENLTPPETPVAATYAYPVVEPLPPPLIVEKVPERVEIPEGPPPPFPVVAAASPAAAVRVEAAPAIPPPPPPSEVNAPPRVAARRPPPEPPVRPGAVPTPGGPVRIAPSPRAQPTSAGPRSEGSEAPAPTSAVRVLPPPLPTLAAGAPRAVAPAMPRSPPPASPRPLASTPAPHPAPVSPPALPPSLPAEPPAPDVPKSTTRRKRKTPARAPRKVEPTPEVPPPAPLAVVETLPETTVPPVLPATMAPPADAGPPPPPKTRKRAVRKRKAPPVVSGTPGEIPVGIPGPESPPPAPPSDAPEKSDP